jgi:hypothetical protein
LTASARKRKTDEGECERQGLKTSIAPSFEALLTNSICYWLSSFHCGPRNLSLPPLERSYFDPLRILQNSNS